jgi:predicted transcriptional regulator
MTPVPLAQDLDYMTSMRVYLDNENDTLGVTSVSAGAPAQAVIVPYGRFRSMTDKQKTDFAMKGKTRFVIAMPGQKVAPTQADIMKVLTSAGVNTVPVNLFGVDNPTIQAQINFWSSNTFYKLKPALLQSNMAAVAGYTPPPNALKA